MSRRVARAAALLIAVGALTGCTGLADGSATSPGPPASTLTTGGPAHGDSTADAIATSEGIPAAAGPSTSLPASPPDARLTGLAGVQAVVGALGSYTWNGAGSDAPWIVAPTAEAATGSVSVRISFDGTVPESWTAGWAPVVDGAAGSLVSGGAGRGDLTVIVPATAGDWTLRVTAVFATGASATYYWRLVVAP